MLICKIDGCGEAAAWWSTECVEHAADSMDRALLASTCGHTGCAEARVRARARQSQRLAATR